MIPIGDEHDLERRGRPFVVWALVAVNAAVFLAGADYGLTTQSHGLRPAGLWAGDPAQLANLLVSAFLHATPLHLAGNLLFLWVFGDDVERELGHLGFLAFYLVCGLAAGLAEALAFPDSAVPRVGASGAIAGVLAGYLVLFPFATVRTIVLPFSALGLFLQQSPVFHLPALLVLGFWLAGQVVGSLGSLAGAESGVAYLAHFGGFLAGYLVLQALRRLFGFAPDHPPPVDLLAPPVPPREALGDGRPILVAARPLPAGHTLAPGDLEPYEWRAVLPEGYFRTRDRERLVGRRLKHERYRFEPIVAADLEPAEERAAPDRARESAAPGPRSDGNGGAGAR